MGYASDITKPYKLRVYDYSNAQALLYSMWNVELTQSALYISIITPRGQGTPLKVPKREIFDRSDFPNFYTIKSLREGDFGVKI